MGGIREGKRSREKIGKELGMGRWVYRRVGRENEEDGEKEGNWKRGNKK